MKTFQEFRHYRAPKSHGESFTDPNIGDVGDQLRGNLELLSQHDSWWQELRRDARQQMISDAVRYTSTYRDVEGMASRRDRPILMAGHQPSLFHPGVWFKNFTLSHLAKQHQALAINLVIDNDAASGSSIRVPTIDRDTGAYVYSTVRYDRFGGGVPYEQTVISDRERFNQFDDDVRKTVMPIVSDPLVNRLWVHARSAVERCGIAGCALAQARHALEGEIGLQTLELPLGVLCRTRMFADFLLRILMDLSRFQDAYNTEADFYRKAHGIRSSSHPVPNLHNDDGWLEAPIWIYSDAVPQRRAGWVKVTGKTMIISDRNGQECRITMEGPGGAEALSHAIGPQFKIRPRALLTTMYARLVLSDLFLHGIGGGKYDQLGDRIAERFFGITPPDFMVVSATVQLPGPSPSETDAEIARLKRAIRDSRFQPEKVADGEELDASLIAEKRQLLDHVPSLSEKPAWHQQLDSINEQLSASLAQKRAELQAELAAVMRERASLAVLKSREHPFCIFPLRDLVKTFDQLIRRSEAGEDAVAKRTHSS
ncbi:hypothetical protein RMSM_04829 [Rhodopirellula maiorica SM1]|uniref:Uncharacterized protein n=1 Tax=Rhodopirellula maiorica SM1 TaxID=1265738 RepID=M5RFM4_9BACT|nr:hypothetical protein [Rhodopirellula maiorica]EMI18268.1 hypothetical protein RMSM_04829 [Rhodopirellula maiorica SM1]